jgi:hypothetical protein
MKKITGAGSAYFELHKNGLFYRNYDGVKIKICDAVEVIAIVSNLEATQWGKLIEFANAHGRKINLVVPMKLLMGTHRYLAEELSSRGLCINSSMLCMRLLREYLTGENPKKILMLNYKWQWNRAIFIKPRNEILEAENANHFDEFWAERKNEDTDKIVSKLKNFIAKNKNFFQDLDNPNQRQLLQKVGYKKKVDGKLYYYILQKIFKKEIADNQEAINVLVKIGLVVSFGNRSTCQTINCPIGICRVYVVKSEK